MKLRPLNPADLDLICRHREEMFRASGRAAQAIVAMAGPFRRWLEPRLADGRYFGWIAMEDQAAVGGLGMMEIDWPPHPLHPEDDRRGYILNVYVEPDHRGGGIARALMDRAGEEARERGLRYVILHATAQAKRLYEQLGWTPTAEMALSIDERLE